MTTCSLSSPSTPCRKAHGSCDLPEKCDGISTQCPQDNVKQNWESCNDKGYAVCFFGECKSHSSQCADIWGDDSYSAHDSCYDLNEAGEICTNDFIALLCGKRLPHRHIITSYYMPMGCPYPNGPIYVQWNVSP